MKVLIATSVPRWGPYIPELIEELERFGVYTEVFDLEDLGRLGLAAKIALRIPQLRYRTTVALLKRRLAHLPTDFESVQIHFADSIYRDLAGPLRRHGKRLVTNIWGSEFLRAGPAALGALGHTLGSSDIVTIDNAAVGQMLIARYTSISDRLRIIPFGLRSLDVIARLLQSERQEESRARIGVPAAKVVIACGYNGIREQRHGMMIEALAALSADAKSRLFALFPMTYPADPTYQGEVRALLAAAHIEYRVFPERMSIEDVCRVRIVSDYAVNVQTTDTLSASLREHMFAGSCMIVGTWLPYGIFEEMGVGLQRVESVAEISAVLEKAASEPKVGGERPTYANKLYAHSSWSHNIGKWLEVCVGEGEMQQRVCAYGRPGFGAVPLSRSRG
jgi:hypothetical protein